MRILGVFPVGLLLSSHPSILRIVREKNTGSKKKDLDGDYLVSKSIELVWWVCIDDHQCQRGIGFQEGSGLGVPLESSCMGSTL